MPIQITIEGLAELQAAAAKCNVALARSLDEALDEAGQMVTKTARGIAPKFTGRMARSITPSRGASFAEVRVTATNRGYPYPALKIEPAQPFLVPAIKQEAPRIIKRMEEVLTDVGRQWGA